ncbi:hypothetical protein QNH28_03560 [Paenibacillus sp. G2S3]|uniref:hypothetical protein n=1 Tax=Paenibacillus sp. G2S3 TaxID=3047872 RepID=UPI0024C19DC7|nr:hypothetical protein [Paenibacillus sp. G2S3]WHY20111.1 hypothetical protein QNH28_03560 [Paenibacillus sp. G2S3]
MKNRLRDYGNQVCEEYIKYKPTSSSVKPVHIANGLFRLISGESYTVEALNDWIIRWKQGEEICSASQIREKYSTAFDANSFDDDEINKLRHYMNIIFNADGAAYPSASNTVLTISSKTQVRSSVPGEASINNFLYNVLLSDVNGKASPCIQLIKEALNDEKDDLSRIASPLTNFSIKKSVESHKKLSNYTLSGVEGRIRDSFDRLAENSKSYNKLLTLERIILLGCFAIISHLSSRVLDISPNYTQYDRVPMLFDADGSLPAIKFASEETLQVAKLMVEEFFEKGLEDILQREGYDKYSHEKMLSRIEDLPMEDSSKKTTSKQTEDVKRKSYKALYLGYYEQYRDPFQAFVKATRFKLFADEFSTDPSAFIASLGGKIALLTPRAQTSGRKRYSPDPLMLEIILHSILDANKKFTLGDFGHELWNSYGIIIGANPETDLEHLKKWRVSQIVPGDLAGELAKNAEKIADILISMGYGKKYADGVTVISL